MTNKANKKVKVIEKIGNITYLESDYDDKPKRRLSAERKKAMSEKRRKREVQPRTGQSKKCQSLYSQLHKDYIKQTSAMGKYMRGKSANMFSKDNYDPTDLNNNDNNFDLEEYINYNESEDNTNEEVASFNNGKHIGYSDKVIKPIKITPKDKKKIAKWLKRKEKKLKELNANHGLLNEYDIQKLLFNEFKINDTIMQNFEDNGKNNIYYEDGYINNLDNELFNHFNNEDKIFIDHNDIIPSMIDKKLYDLLYSQNQEDNFDSIKGNNYIQYKNITYFFLNKINDIKLLDSYIDVMVYAILANKPETNNFPLIKEYIKAYCSDLLKPLTVPNLKLILKNSIME